MAVVATTMLKRIMIDGAPRVADSEAGVFHEYDTHDGYIVYFSQTDVTLLSNLSLASWILIPLTVLVGGAFFVLRHLSQDEEGEEEG